MNIILHNLTQIADEHRSDPPLYLRNLLKEALQYYVLNYVYNSAYADKLLFKGGTCLRFCFDLPRLSEDLDFDVVMGAVFTHQQFKTDLLTYFQQKLQFLDLQIQLKGKHNLMYLNFPVLDQLGYQINKPSDSTLFVRLDVTPAKGQQYQTEISLKSIANFSFLMKRYSLADLFAGKLAAILQRATLADGQLLPRFKGRDYYDLFWFLEKKVTPNWPYLFEITNYTSRANVLSGLKIKLTQAVKKKKTLKQDLLPFFADVGFVEKFVDNLDALLNQVNLLK
ncbi:MAG: nucleotidyl transferase AbiEii/AbiGii toxin family protein [Patescibacteria group bacterium]|nr:nucleotidyl transferase AbiEii/AbiGii toxin family protein [Patescibacteria group bacterium]